jgi:hypothetical protein
MKKLFSIIAFFLFFGLSVTSSTGNISEVSSVCKSNNPPYEPSNPNPIGPDATICGNLSWTGGDPDGDDVTYDVFFGDQFEMNQVAWNQSETWVQLPDILDFLRTYYWYVVAWDEHGAYTVGEIWSFSTEQNYPPNPAEDPNPPDGDPNVPTEGVVLCWNGSDPNLCDTLIYDLYFDDVDPPHAQVLLKTCINWWEISYTLPKYKTYYWKVDTYDRMGEFTEGHVWNFTTGYPSPPSAPIIDGPTQGKVGVEYTYTFNSTDSDGEHCRCYVDWGDDSPIEIVYPTWPNPEETGPGIANHSWDKKGFYLIRAIAEDEHGAKSDPGELPVTMPRNKILYYSLLLNLLDKCPLIQGLLNVLGRYIK